MFGTGMRKLGLVGAAAVTLAVGSIAMTSPADAQRFGGRGFGGHGGFGYRGGYGRGYGYGWGGWGPGFALGAVAAGYPYGYYGYPYGYYGYPYGYRPYWRGPYRYWGPYRR